MSFYDWKGVLISDKEQEETTILRRSGNNFNKLAHSTIAPTASFYIKTSSRFQQEEVVYKRITKNSEVFNKEKKKKPAIQGKAFSVYHLGYTYFSNWGVVLVRGRTLKSRCYHKITTFTNPVHP